MAKLCLGTAQFGMKYGINNKLGQPSKEDCFNMLDIAMENNISKIDTASAYGIAEELLGEYILDRKLKNKIDIISKLMPNILENSYENVDIIIKKEIEKSLKKLNIEQLDAYLLHTPNYVYREDVLAALLNCKKEGLIKNIGVSIYEIEDGFAAIQSEKIDYIQLPYNVFDQRGEKTNFMSEAKKKNITIFTRSAFLQGLLLADKEEIPDYISDIRKYIEIYEQLLEQYQIEKVNGLLHFVCDNENIDYLVFGVDTKEQLLYHIDCIYNKNISLDFINAIKENFKDIDNRIISPNLWTRK